MKYFVPLQGMLPTEPYTGPDPKEDCCECGRQTWDGGMCRICRVEYFNEHNEDDEPQLDNNHGPNEGGLDALP